MESTSLCTSDSESRRVYSILPRSLSPYPSPIPPRPSPLLAKNTPNGPVTLSQHVSLPPPLPSPPPPTPICRSLPSSRTRYPNEEKIIMNMLCAMGGDTRAPAKHHSSFISLGELRGTPIPLLSQPKKGISLLIFSPPIQTSPSLHVSPPLSLPTPPPSVFTRAVFSAFTPLFVGFLFSRCRLPLRVSPQPFSTLTSFSCVCSAPPLSPKIRVFPPLPHAPFFLPPPPQGHTVKKKTVAFFKKKPGSFCFHLPDSFFRMPFL